MPNKEIVDSFLLVCNQAIYFLVLATTMCLQHALPGTAALVFEGFVFSMKICRECFYAVFEEEIHRVIVDNQLFKPGERIAIGASGGKGELFCLGDFSADRSLLHTGFQYTN